jgi:hypothetical protein
MTMEFFSAIPPQLTTCFHLDPKLLQAVDNGQRAESGCFDERTVNLRRRGVERLARPANL